MDVRVPHACTALAACLSARPVKTAGPVEGETARTSHRRLVSMITNMTHRYECDQRTTTSTES